MKKLVLTTGLAATLAFSLCSCDLENLANLGEQTGTDSLQYSLSETKSNIQSLGNNEGFMITATFKTDSTQEEAQKENLTFGVKDNITWYIQGEEGAAYKFENNKTHIFDYQDNEFVYEYTTSYENGSDSFVSSYAAWLYMGNVYDGSFVKKGTATVAGRSCDIYVYSINLLVESVSYSFSIDKQTGATLKCKIEGNVGTESGSYEFEVTSFKTGSSVTLPTLPAFEENNYNDEEDNWDDNDDDNGESTKKKAYELFESKDDLHCITNELFVLKYQGTYEQLVNEDDSFVDDYGTLDIYYAWYGFYDDGDINKIHGWDGLFYFFSDEATYQAAITKAGSWLKGKNDDALYIVTYGYAMEGESYSECIEYYTNDTDYRHPNFILVN